MGLVTTYAYNAFGEKTESTPPAGSGLPTISYTYYLNGNIESETQPNGTTTTYSYDNLAEIIDISNPTSVITENFYDVLGQQVES